MSDKRNDNDSASEMDALRIKSMPTFKAPERKGAPSADAQAPNGAKSVSSVIDASELKRQGPKLVVVKGGSNLSGQEFRERTVERSASAKVEAGSDGLSASVSLGTRTEVKEGSAVTIESLQEALRASGLGKDGKPVSLEDIARVVREQLGIDIDEQDERAEEVRGVAEHLAAGIRQESGSQVSAGVSAGSGAGPAGTAGSTVGAELAGGAAALVGGIAGLVGGSMRAVGASLSGLGAKPESPISRFNDVMMLQGITSYRVKKVEDLASEYAGALDTFWQLPKMQMLRSEIEERARQSGLSVPDAMAKMKPGGEWEELHNKFTAEVAASPEATKAKVALDSALKGFIKQHDRSMQELETADLDGNPKHRDAQDRVEAAQEKMSELTALSPVFAGERQSHAERFTQALNELLERLRNRIAMVLDKTFGRASHDSP